MNDLLKNELSDVEYNFVKSSAPNSKLVLCHNDLWTVVGKKYSIIFGYIYFYLGNETSNLNIVFIDLESMNYNLPELDIAKLLLDSLYEQIDPNCDETNPDRQV